MEEKKLKNFIKTHEKKLIPLFEKYMNSLWLAQTTGKKEHYQDVEKFANSYSKIYSNSKDYKKLKKISEKKIKDNFLKRQLILLKNNYKGSQLPQKLLQEMNKKSTKISQKFNLFRGKVDGKKVSQNQIEKVLQDEKNSLIRRKFWEAQKSVGSEIEKDLISLVKLRNDSAVSLGYKNYYEMSLELQEIDSKWLKKTFDTLLVKTEKSFKQVKKDIDVNLAQKFGIGVDELRPWHYSDPFFQENPLKGNVYSKFYSKVNIVDLVKKFYNGIGLPVDKILLNSDLYERKNKCPHAFCIDMDKKGDVRILMNARNTVDKINTLLHECGHAVYDLGIDSQLPFLLREPSHVFTTEAIAMMFGKLAYDGDWMQQVMGLSDKQANKLKQFGNLTNKRDQLVLSRWMQVMVNFERNMYENPQQDLNSLWWNLVEKYQHVKKPDGRDAPDFASKIHLSTNPVYYQNYQLGELMASQLHNIIMNNITLTKPYNNVKEIGIYLKEKVFAPGTSLKWDELVKQSTGKKLGVEDFIKEYC